VALHMIPRKLIIILFVFLVFAIFLFMVSPARLTSTQVPSAAGLGRYVLWADNYWMVVNKTIQQLSQEGYDITGAPDKLLHVNYTRLDYSFKSKIVKINWPNVTVELTEREYDLNVTAYDILVDGTIGEKVGSFLRENQPSRTGRTYDTWAPSFGPGFDPTVLWNGNTFTVWLEYHVTGPEIFYNTPWGQNETFVLVGESINSTHSFRGRVWCDAQTGIILKHILEIKMPNLVTREEQTIIETGIEAVKQEFPDLPLIIGASIIVAIVAVAGITIYSAKTRRRKNVKT